MKQNKQFRIAVLMILCVLSVMVSASAAHVSKVTCKEYYTRDYQYAVIRGRTSSGKTVWTYKSAKYEPTELSAVRMKTRGKYVYVLEGRKYVRLGKQSGRVLVKKNVLPSGCSCGSPVMLVSKSGALYAMGYYSTEVYRISQNGTVKWKTDLGDPYFWVNSMSMSDGILTIRGENSEKWRIKMKASNGSVVKRYLTST